MIKKLIVLLTLAVLYGCGSDAPSIFKSEIEGSAKNFEDDIHGTYASTYTPLKSENVVIRNATIFDGNGNKFLDYDVHFSDGKIKNLGVDLEVEGARAVSYTHLRAHET